MEFGLLAVAMSTTLVVAFATGQQLPGMAGIAQAPWWSWLGGLFAAGFVLSLTLVADKLGASLFQVRRVVQIEERAQVYSRFSEILLPGKDQIAPVITAEMGKSTEKLW